MVAFAVGGLLGDTLFHLLPEIFLGEDSPEHVRFVLVEPNRNLLLGVAIMVGFVTFVAMDKGLRIATGGEGGHDGKTELVVVKAEKEISASVKLAGYLNLMCVFRLLGWTRLMSTVRISPIISQMVWRCHLPSTLLL
jgi:zinc transporter 7